MAYVVLARKFRPRNFEEVKGQDQTVRALVNALDHNRLHHAYLFSGTRGVGKTTLARIFANCLNCEQGISSNPCGTCFACEGFQQGNYPDMYEIDAASRTGVEDMRRILENLHYSPSVGRFKIYLIDEVHMLSTASFNALLKTLEEPPEHVKFIFATTDPRKIPLTVLSRCLHFHLRSLDPNVIKSQLEDVLSSESIEFDPPALGLLSRAAQGSMRDALSLTDQAISHGGGFIREDQVAEMLGAVVSDEVSGILERIAANNHQEVLAFVDRLANQAVSMVDLLDALQRAIHQLALAQVTGAVNDESLSPFNGKFTSEWLQIAYQILTIGLRDLKFAPDHRVGFEMTMLRLLDFEPVKKGGVRETKRTPPDPTRSTPKTSDHRLQYSRKQEIKPKSTGLAVPQQKPRTTEPKQKVTPKLQPSRKPSVSGQLLAFVNDPDLQEKIESDPMVQAIIQNFQARIVDVVPENSSE